MTAEGESEDGVVTIAGDHLRVEVLPQAGAEIRFVGEPAGPNVLAAYDWETPAPLGTGGSYGSPLSDWLSAYRGGWQELFPNAGDACAIGEVGLPFHGEVSRIAWQVVEQTPDSLVLRAPSRLPLVVERRMTIASDAAVLRIEEAVRNPTDVPASFVWGHHPAFEALPGMRIDLAPGAFVADAAMVGPHADLEPGASGEWPNLPDVSGQDLDLSVVPDRPVQRVCYLPDRSDGWAALRHPATSRGIAMAWDVDTFPHLWLWEETGTPGFPWYGRARIVAIEPQAAWPNDGLASAIRRGQAHELEGGGVRRTWLTLRLFSASADPVTGVDRDGRISIGERLA